MAGIRISGAAVAPAPRPERVLGDKAYSSRPIRAQLRRRRITTTIAERVDQQANRARRGSQGGRPPHVDKDRNVVERCVNTLTQFRAVATGSASRRADRSRWGAQRSGTDSVTT